MTTKILIADDHKIIREGLRSLLEKQSDMEVIAEAQDGLTTVRLAQKLLPHVVIMDIGMPEMNGIDATRQIVAEKTCDIKVIALSMHSDRRFVLQMLKAGASGYLLKDSAFEELITAIHTIMMGQPYLSPKVMDVVVKEYLHGLAKNETSVFTALTAREREVLQLLAEGKSTKQIASLLNVSVKTIETHRQQLMEKLGIHSIAELTKYAIREGLTSLEP
jgi:two-component system, NarL family, response regulator NreC